MIGLLQRCSQQLAEQEVCKGSDDKPDIKYPRFANSLVLKGKLYFVDSREFESIYL